MNLRQHILLIGILFFCNTSYSKSDSTIILIEKKGIYLSPINLSNEFKIYSLTKYDTSKVKKYKEVKLNWIKSLKTDLSPSGLIIDTANLHGQFLVASNFNLPGNFLSTRTEVIFLIVVVVIYTPVTILLWKLLLESGMEQTTFY